jgi:hypothetical protein
MNKILDRPKWFVCFFTWMCVHERCRRTGIAAMDHMEAVLVGNQEISFAIRINF